MLARLLKTLVLFSFVFSSLSFAAQGPQSFTLDGILKQAGTNNPLLDPAVTITVQIMDPTKQCLLYEEQQTVSTSTSKGYFNIVVGSDLGSPKRTGNDPGLATYQIYQNSGSVIASNVPGQTCAGGLFTPVTQDYRYMRIIVTPSSTGVADTLSPDTLMDAVPAAVVAEWAESVGGFTPNDLLKVNVSGGMNLSQVNLESLFTPAAWPNLQAVAAGNFMNKTANNGASLPTYTTGAPPAAPAEGSIWFDSDTNQIKYYDGAATQIVGTSGMGVTSVDTSLNLTVDNVAGGSITSTGTLDLSNTGVVAGTYPKVQVDAKGRVLAGTATLLETDLPAVIDDPGRVSGDAITSGTIGGSTSIATTGTVSAASASFRQIDLYDSDNSNYVRFLTPATGVLTSNYTLTFPANAGTSGQALTTDGSGGLAWTTIVTDVGNTADLGDGMVWIGDGAGTAQERAISGDIAITNTGVATIQADTVTYAKIQNVTDNRLLGRSAGSAGDVQEIQVGTGLTMAAGTIALTDTTDDDTLGGLSCANNEVPRWNGAAWVCQLANTANSNNTLVLRDGSGNFAANNITAAQVSATNVVVDNAGNSVTLVSGATAPYSLTLPLDDGQSGQVLSTDGAGVLSWINALTSATGYVNGGNSFGANATIGLNDNFRLDIETNNTPRVTVGAGGNVGIGITNPSAKLDVDGNITLGASGTHGILHLRRSDGVTSGRIDTNNGLNIKEQSGGGWIGFWTNSGSVTEKMRIIDSGNVGIGVTDPDVKLEVAGTIRVGDGSETCSGGNFTGGIRYNGGNLQFCDGAAWNTLGLAGSGITSLTGDVTATGPGAAAATIANDAVTSAKILDGTIATGDLADNAVATAKIADDAVTYAKIQNINTQRLLGRGTAAVGNVEEISLGAGLTLTGTTLDVTDGTDDDTLGGLSCAANEVPKWNGAVWVCQLAESANGNGSLVLRDGSGNFASNNITANGLSINNAGSLVNISSPVGANYNLILPADDGDANQVLGTDGSGALDWVDAISSATGYINGGNSFGADASIGLNDNFRLDVKTNNAIRMTVAADGNVGIGTTSPLTKLSISANTAAPLTPNTGSNLQITGQDDLSTAFTMDAFGDDFYDSPYVTLRKANGTAASPLPTEMNDILGMVEFQGYYGGFENRGAVSSTATENWTATARGTATVLAATKTGTTSTILATLSEQGLGINVGHSSPVPSQLTISANTSRTSWTTTGSNLSIGANTSTDTSGAGVIATRTSSSFAIPTFASSSAVTVTNAANVYIAGAPTAGANTTLTNSHALHVAAGNSYFGGNIGIGVVDPDVDLEIAGTLRVGDGGETCSGGNFTGGIRYNGGNLQFCDGAAWNTLGVAGSGITSLTGDVTASGPGAAATTIANDAVTSAKILDGTIATGDLADDAVTFAKMQNINTQRLLGRGTAAVGDVEEISLGAGLTLTGTTLDVTDGTDDDALGALSCAANEVPKWNGSAWVCQLAESANGNGSLVLRDGSGNFASNQITANTFSVNNAGSLVNVVSPIGANYTLTLPAAVGSANQVLTDLDGAGTLGWSTPLTSSTGYLNGGNSFGADASIGLNDNYRLDVKTNNAVRMTVAPDGQVGIGTTDPAAELHVQKNGAGYAVMRVENNYVGAGNNFAQFSAYNGTTEAAFGIRGIGASGYGAMSPGDGYLYSPTDFVLMSLDDLKFSTGDTLEKMRLSAAGNLGIGTTNPTSNLHVSSSAGTTVTVETSGATSWPAYEIVIPSGATTGGGSFGVKQGSTEKSGFGYNSNLDATFIDSIGLDPILFMFNGTEQVRVTSTGNIGIGTTNPQFPLHIKNNTSAVGMTETINNTFTNASAFIGRRARDAGAGAPGATQSWDHIAVFSGRGYGTTGWASASNAGMHIIAEETMTDTAQGAMVSFFTTAPGGTSKTEKMTIRGDGNVGIGTNIPSAPLQVQSPTSGSLEYVAKFQNPNGNVGAAAALGFKVDVDGTSSQYKGGIAFERTATNGRGSIHFMQNNAADITSAAISDAKMTIVAGGNVGIGTTDPQYKLDVAGDVNVTGNFKVNGVNIATGGGDFMRDGSQAMTGTFKAANGSVALPSITFNGDQDTGISWGGSNQISFSAGAAEMFEISASGFGGQGAEAPLVRSTGSTVNAPAYTFVNDTNTGMTSTAADTLQFSTNGAERARIDSSGNVGIGTTNPQGKLHVSALTGILRVDSTAGGAKTWSVLGNTSNDRGWATSYDSSTGNFEIGYMGSGLGGNATNHLVINNTGNVGIGTTNPNLPLTVYGGTNTLAATIGFPNSNPGDWTGLSFGYPTTAKTGIIFTKGSNGNGRGHLHLATSDATSGTVSAADARLTVLQTGNVGIGTTTPGRILHVNGVMRLEPSALPGTPSAGDIAIDSGAANALKFYNGSAWQTVTTGGGGATSIDGLSDGKSESTSVFLGTSSGAAHTSGTNNAAVGFYALEYLTDGDNNVAMGYNAGVGITSQNHNVAIGYNTLYGITNGTTHYNTAVGSGALFNNGPGVGSNNTSVGYDSMTQSTGSYNVAMGITALDYSSGNNNIGIGESAASSAAGNHNIALGKYAFTNTTGADNVMIGREVFFNNGGNQSAAQNVVVGGGAGGANKVRSASNNVILGFNSGYDISSGSNNVIIGKDAGNTLTTGGSNILIGTGVLTPANNTSNFLNIGNTIYGNTSNGRVGIGTTNPTDSLDIVGAANGSGAGHIYVQNTTNGTAAFGEVGARNHSNVTTAIGTVASTYNAMSAIPGGAGYLSSGSATGLSILSNHATGSIRLYTGGSASTDEKMRITSGGNVGIGTTNPSEELEVNGDVKATSFISTSDERLKNNIATTPGLESIMKLRGVSWNWKNDGSAGMGVIAQELEKVFPEAVVTDPSTGYKSVRYSNLIAPLIESTKELAAMCEANARQIASVYSRVGNLEKANQAKDRRIQELEKENAAMKARLEKIEKALGLSK